MAKTKGDLVLKALRKAGLYSNATLTDADPQAIEDAINDLEDMMAAWQAKGIELGYQFADTENGIMPLPDDDSGIPAWANDGVALKLVCKCAWITSFSRQTLSLPLLTVHIKQSVSL